MNKIGILGWLIFVVVLLILGFFWFVGEWNKNEVECVPASCCHASECVDIRESPNCSDRICTMDCVVETMDCGQGHCEFNGKECEVVWDE